MLLLPYAIFRSAHVHIGRRVVGVARLAIPITRRRLGRTPSCTCWPLRRRSIQVQVQSSQTHSTPQTLVLACWLCSARIASLHRLTRAPVVSTSIVSRAYAGAAADHGRRADAVATAAVSAEKSFRCSLLMAACPRPPLLFSPIAGSAAICCRCRTYRPNSDPKSAILLCMNVWRTLSLNLMCVVRLE